MMQETVFLIRPFHREMLFTTMFYMTAWTASIAHAIGDRKRPRKRNPKTIFDDNCNLTGLPVT